MPVVLILPRRLRGPTTETAFFEVKGLLVPHQGPPLVTPQDLEFSSLPTRGPAAYSGSPVSLTPGCQEMRHVLIPPYVLPEPTVMGSTFPSVYSQGPHPDFFRT